MCIVAEVLPFRFFVPQTRSSHAPHMRVSVPAGQTPTLLVQTCPAVNPASMGPYSCSPPLMV